MSDPWGKNVKVEFEDGIAWLKLNRPDKRNAMSVALATEMNQVLDDLEIDDLSAISDVIASVGGSARDFEAYIAGPARAEHDRIIEEAEALGVFGVPTMVFNGELFWGGDRIDMLIERIRNPASAAAALGSRHRKQG